MLNKLNKYFLIIKHSDNISAALYYTSCQLRYLIIYNVFIIENTNSIILMFCSGSILIVSSANF